MAGVRAVEDLLVYQLAREFKLEVYRLVRSMGQVIDFKYQGQLFDAASGVEANLSEGFKRNVPGEFAQFIRYASASLAEARVRLRDGVDRGYFTVSECQHALGLGKRCADAMSAFQRSQARCVGKGRAAGRRSS
jgi:four helix bundle protein